MNARNFDLRTVDARLSQVEDVYLALFTYCRIHCQKTLDQRLLSIAGSAEPGQIRGSKSLQGYSIAKTSKFIIVIFKPEVVVLPSDYVCSCIVVKYSPWPRDDDFTIW